MDGGQVISRIKAVCGSTRALLAVSTAMIPVALLAAAPAGHADDVPPAQRYAVGSPAMQVAQQFALANWGMNACGGQVEIVWGVDDANINARSYWANPVSSYDNPDQNTQCRIVFNSNMAYTWPKFCTVLVHEYGHLTGHPHSADGPDVMSPIYRAPLPACVSADPSAPVPAPTPVAPPTVSTTPTPPASSVVDAPVKRTKRLKGRIAKARSHRRARAAKAKMAVAPLKHFSDADAEPLPWQPFVDA